MDNKRINDIILHYLSGEISPLEEKELQAWCNESPENSAYFEKIKHLWVVSSVLREKPMFEAEGALNGIHEELLKTTPGKGAPRALRVGFSRAILPNWVKYAALLVFVFSTGAFSSLFLVNHKEKIQEVAENYYEVPMGSKGCVTLPDGSKVWLNAGSKLNYSTDFNTQDRVVELEGEGFFDVSTDPGKPFIVKTPEMSILAYGTSFNVKAYPDEATITTTLVEGNVKIEGTGEDKNKLNVSLKPNQTLTFVKKSFKPKALLPDRPATLPERKPVAPEPKVISNVKLDKNVKTTLYTSWKDDTWIIEREKLDDFIVKLERRFDVTFIYKSESLKEYKISGIIRKETLEQVLDILKLTAPLKYIIKEGVVTLEMDIERAKNYSKVMN